MTVCVCMKYMEYMKNGWMDVDGRQWFGGVGVTWVRVKQSGRRMACRGLAGRKCAGGRRHQQYRETREGAQQVRKARPGSWRNETARGRRLRVVLAQRCRPRLPSRGPTKHLHRPNTGPPRDVGLHQAKCRPP